MSIQRGDVAIVDFSVTYPSARRRPALIVQNDRDNARMDRTIVAQITTNTSRAHEDTQYPLDDTHPDFADSGLRAASVVNASNLVTIPQSDIVRVIGSLSDQTMQEIDECLKAALGMS